MTASAGPPTSRYDALYAQFDSPLMCRLRREAYGQDFGQHSWVDAAELLDDAGRLGLGPQSRLLDLGCGPGGPLTFLMARTGCSGLGLELSEAALHSATARAASLGLGQRFSGRQADLDQPLPPGIGRFDAVIATDVVLHLADRSRLFAEVRRVLESGGRFLFTDAGIVTGAVSAAEFALRSLHGHCEFVTTGWNERLLQEAGFALIAQEDRTAAVRIAATGRLRAMQVLRAELESLWGVSQWQEQADYLAVVAALSERHAISRWMFLAECA